MKQTYTKVHAGHYFIVLSLEEAETIRGIIHSPEAQVSSAHAVSKLVLDALSLSPARRALLQLLVAHLRCGATASCWTRLAAS